MDQWLGNPLAGLVFWTAVLVLLVVAAACLIGKLRRSRDNPSASASELISDFREIHDRGGLSDAEFRTIKSMLAEQLQEQTRGNGSAS